jgi:hypothetical protein
MRSVTRVVGGAYYTYGMTLSKSKSKSLLCLVVSFFCATMYAAAASASAAAAWIGPQPASTCRQCSIKRPRTSTSLPPLPTMWQKSRLVHVYYRQYPTTRLLRRRLLLRPPPPPHPPLPRRPMCRTMMMTPRRC